MFVSPVHGLIFVAAVLVAIFIVNVVLAPKRQRDEARGLLKVWREGYLDRQLDIHVAVHAVFVTDSKGFYRLNLGLDGLIIILKNIRFINRSTTNRVSLDLTLMVPLRLSAGGRDYLPVKEQKILWDQTPDYFLFSPFSIGPGDIESGDMCFLIQPETVRECGGKGAIDHNRCRLEIVDFVSREKVVKDIGQEMWESRQVNIL